MVSYGKMVSKAQEGISTVLTETEKFHLEESMRHNNDLLKRLAEL